MMTYQQTIEYLYSRLPMFSSQGQSAIKPGLENIIKFCELLDNPHRKFKSIHVGGTNGKGSTSHMLAAILQTAGYKTGLYTSPHLRDFRERIRIDGEMISEAEVTSFVGEHKANIEQIEPSFFEATVALAFDHFVRHAVEVAVIEVGLGGRLDSTNIIRPELSVITNIGLDHVNILGDTVQLIAAEKAGIIKPEVPVIIGERQQEIADVFISTAAKCGSRIVFASDEWEIKKHIDVSPQQNPSQPVTRLLDVTAFPKSANHLMIKSLNSPQSFKYSLDLTGYYQLKNLATVLSSVEQLRLKGFKISDDDIESGLGRVTEITGLMGRWQTLSTAPLIICDTGHNVDGIREVLKNITATPFDNLHMVIGMVKDKDITKVLKLLPEKATYYFCKPQIPRAKDAEDIRLEAKEAGLTGDAYGSVKQALEAAKINAGSNDLIFVGGSTFVVAEIV